MNMLRLNLEALPVTRGPRHHFFGYYDKLQWDLAGRYLLAHEADFAGRRPRPGESAVIGLVDMQEGCAFQPFSETRAWCWQQGSMLQWLPGAETLVIHNDRIGDRFLAVVIDIDSGERRMLPRPVYTVSNDGRMALSLNFSRLAVERPGYGYEGLRDNWETDPHPAEDGLYLMDLHSGEHRLIVSLDRIYRLGREQGLYDDDSFHRFNHLLFNPDDSRFIFLHRWRGERGGGTRLCTAAPDGSDVFFSRLEGGSHFIWYDSRTILIYGRLDDVPGYYLVGDGTDDIRPVAAGALTRDGHCSLSGDRRWMLTDEYQDEHNRRPIILFDLKEQVRYDLGRFYSAPPPPQLGDCRCDLHPRWSRDERFICFDSSHEGSRQMYVMDISEVATEPSTNEGVQPKEADINKDAS